METPEVVRLPTEQLPDSISFGGALELRLSPNQMRALKAETGKTLEDLIGAKADDADRLQAIVWLELRRQGYDARWDSIGDVAIQFQTEEPDPTNSGGSTSSPPSAASGA